MNYANPGGWKKRRAAKKKRRSHAPSPEARAQRKAMRLGVAVQSDKSPEPESGKHEIQHKGKGWYDVIAPSGEVVNTQSLRMAQAKTLVEELDRAYSPKATPSESNDDEPQGDNGLDQAQEPA